MSSIATPASLSSAPGPVAATGGAPAMYALTENSVTIIWALKKPSRVWIEYGEQSDRLDQRVHDEGLGLKSCNDLPVKMRITGLLPGKRYWWRTVARPLATRKTTCANAAAWECSGTYSFCTLNARADEASFAVWGDTRGNCAVLSKLGRITFRDRPRRPDFIVWNGGVGACCKHVPGQNAKWHVQPAGIDLAACAPIMLARGDCEAFGPGADDILRCTDFPTSRKAPVRSYYAFRQGPVAAIVLDVCGGSSRDSLIAEQAHWLQRITTRIDIKSAPVKMVFCHKPLRPMAAASPDFAYSGNGERGLKSWLPALSRWGAQVIVSGYAAGRHVYQPPVPEFPFAHITTGGSKFSETHFLDARATRAGLQLSVRDMHGKEVRSLDFFAAGRARYIHAQSTAFAAG